MLPVLICIELFCIPAVLPPDPICRYETGKSAPCVRCTRSLPLRVYLHDRSVLRSLRHMPEALCRSPQHSSGYRRQENKSLPPDMHKLFLSFLLPVHNKDHFHIRASFLHWRQEAVLRSAHVRLLYNHFQMTTFFSLLICPKRTLLNQY